MTIAIYLDVKYQNKQTDNHGGRYFDCSIMVLTKKALPQGFFSASSLFYSRYKIACSEEIIEPNLRFTDLSKAIRIAEPSRLHDFRYKLEPLICETSKFIEAI